MRTILNSRFAVITGAVLFTTLAGSTRLAAAEAPLVGISGATNVTTTSATLRGSVNPKSLATTAWLEWGPGELFSSVTAQTNLSSGSSAVNIGFQVSGLSLGIIYHYRVAASNALGVIRSTPIRFGRPKLTVLGANPVATPLDTNYVDPGIIVTSTPVAMVAGFLHNVVLKADGQVVAWGNNDNGQSTVPSTLTNVVSVSAGGLHTIALRANGSVTGWGYNDDGEVTIPSNATNNVIAITAGGFHNLALKSDNSVVAWGANWDGQSSVPPEATNVIALAAGNSHNLALRADGTVVAWGTPFDGQTIVPPEATNVTAIAAGGDHSLALRADGTVVTWGSDSDGQTTQPDGVTNIVAIAAGYRFSLALKGDGSMMAWGANDNGQTNFPPEAANSIALAGGVNHAISLKPDGTVVYWGTADPLLTDIPDGLNTPTNLITISGAVITNVVGTYTLTYRVTNALGFGASATRVVLVGDAVPSIHALTLLGDGSSQLSLDFLAGKTFTVLATTNVALPSSWTVLGTAVEKPAGHYEFNEASGGNLGQRYYRVRMAVP